MNNIQFYNAVNKLISIFNEHQVTYQFYDATSLIIQGVEINVSIVHLEVQWDVFPHVYELLNQYKTSAIDQSPRQASFNVTLDEVDVLVSCFYNTTIKTDPYRVLIDQVYWCRSLYSYLYDQTNRYEKEIHHYLALQQSNFTKQNEVAWNQNHYATLVNRYGEPIIMAEKIINNPKWRLHPFYKYFGDVTNKKIAHLMGSNGIKATALALLGASVSVFDFSQENAKYANELALHANVKIDYYLTDILGIPTKISGNQFDQSFMELGVLHYYIDLHPLFNVVKYLLKPGGRFILHEFHPISTKLITSTGKKHKISGNYFDISMRPTDVAFSKHTTQDEQEQLSTTIQRRWTLGEIITSLASCGFKIVVLEEEPNHKIHDIGIPKTFTIVAEL